MTSNNFAKPNSAPAAVDDSGTLNQDTTLSIAVLANDTDADPLNISSFNQPTNGSVTQNGNNLIYTPDTGYFGSDSFSYTVSDGADTDTGNVNVTVNEVVIPSGDLFTN